MGRQGLYYATFILERPGFKPATLQGLYEPSCEMTAPEMRMELYQAIHTMLKSKLKTDRFKLKLTSMTRINTDFVYTPARTAGKTKEKERNDGKGDEA